MKKRKTCILLIWFAFMSTGLLQAQEIQAFSSDPSLFLAELETLFRQVPANQRQVANTLISNLRQGFNTGLISGEQQQAMMQSANAMLAARLRPHPHFTGYFQAASAYQSNYPDGENFMAWNASILKLIAQDNPGLFQNYLERSEQFFKDNVLSQSPTLRWQMYEGDWAMAGDSLPAFQIKNAALICYASRDSIRVDSVLGVFDPLANLWKGIEGRLTWERAGFAAEEVFAEIRDYEISLNTNGFMAEKAWLTFSGYFAYPVPGSFEHKVVANTRPENATYPRFTSDSYLLEIRNVFDGIDYSGGFRLEGSRIIGFGAERNNAQLTLRKDGETLMQFSSHSFVIRTDRITSQRATFSLYLGSDSIYHPGLQLRYLDNERELMLLRPAEGVGQSPFFNSYHHLDMIFEALYWNPDEEVMSFGAMRGMRRTSEAVFESANYFSEARFNRIRGADARHPLIVINNLLRQRKSNVFYIEDLAISMNLAIDQVSAMLINLANQGFLHYNPNDGRAVVKDRTKQYIDAINNQVDYDVILIQSEVEGLVNARLDLTTFDLEIFGIPEVNLSNTQKVFIHPANNRITMKKGLDFLFQGTINAGYFEYHARECAFLYDEFKLNLTEIDSMSFNVPVTADKASLRQELERVKTVISYISGDLLIDHPENKSGRKNYPRYPIFDSKNDSYVYFDQPNIQNGVYKRDTFYYHILPFTIDSLNDFRIAGVSFSGYFNSGNIFPLIEEPLRVQPDFSLGFVLPVDPKGLSLFGGKGTAYAEISLSHQGLRGRGKVEYLSSVLRSEDFIFHPDSMMALLHDFDLKESEGAISNPAVYATNVQQIWIHGDDRMILETTKNIPFEMYNNQLTHAGKLIYGLSGLNGAGQVTYANAGFKSGDFVFRHNTFGAGNSDFLIRSSESGDLFRAQSFSFQFEPGIRQGNFNAVGKNSRLEFPLHKYLAFMDSFRWEAAYEEIYLSNEVAQHSPSLSQIAMLQALEKGDYPVNFISLHPTQDSLRFAAGAARYDLNEFVLEVQEVPFVEVADAGIFPFDGKIIIQRNAQIQPVEGATLIAGTKNRFHKLYNVDANIKGRKSYTASGTYDYTDEFDKTQPVFFKKITPGETGITSGVAEISTDQEFELNPFFDFSGNVSFTAVKRAFYFDGAYRIRHTCDPVENQWVKFEGEVERQNTKLPLTQPVQDLKGKTLATSLMFNLAGNEIYSGFLHAARNSSDQPLLSASGQIYFDPKERSYIIKKTDTGAEGVNSGDILKLNVDRCVLSGEGRFDFGQDLGRVNMVAAGTADYFILPDSAIFTLFSTIDFFFDNQALTYLNESLTKASLAGMDPTNPVFVKGLSGILSEADAQRLLSELRTYGTFRRFPRELMQTMVIGDMQMRWNKTSRSFTSTGQIGIAAINGKLVNRYVDGHVELVRRRTGDALTIYLQPGPTEWYYFSYSAGVMQAISSNEDFNNLLINLRENRRTLTVRGDEAPYQFIISTIQQRNAFLRRMRGG